MEGEGMEGEGQEEGSITPQFIFFLKTWLY